MTTLPELQGYFRREILPTARLLAWQRFLRHLKEQGHIDEAKFEAWKDRAG